ncbi:MAG: hypothetical protein HPY66_0982 [Firmicutes bacterium]|nr:hypothetical protein [Bacillota bacterium]
MAAVHGFRLKNGDHELEKILTDMSGKEKSDFIREALSFYIRYADKINKIDEISSGIREILSKLNDMSVVSLTSVIKEPGIKDVDDKAEKMLKESIQELLNL